MFFIPKYGYVSHRKRGTNEMLLVLERTWFGFNTLIVMVGWGTKFRYRDNTKRVPDHLACACMHFFLWVRLYSENYFKHCLHNYVVQQNSVV